MNTLLAKGVRWLGVLLCAMGLLRATDETAPRPLLHPLLSDQAVLQRGKPVRVWGWATPGAEVSVQLAGEGLAVASVKTRAAADGRWQAELGPFKAGGPYVLSAISGEIRSESRDVLVGDVWLCSGQSNMEMTMAKAKGFAAERAGANLPRLRHIEVQRNRASEPKEMIGGKWQACSPDTVGGFSAVAYFFGRDLHRELDVPIGLVTSAQGGTTCEGWISASRLAAEPGLAAPFAGYLNAVAAVDQQKARTGKDYPELVADWLQANDPGTHADPAWSQPGHATAGWTSARVPGVFEYTGAVPKNYDGTIWVRREVVVPPELAGRRATLKLGMIGDLDTTWVNGVRVGAMWKDYETRAYPVSAKLLKAGANSIAVRIINTGGSAGFKSMKPADIALVFDDGRSLPLAGTWRLRAGVDLKAAPALPLRRPDGTAPASLYNGMIAPLVPMALTGAVWYQGEGNAGSSAYSYRSLLTALIGDWRAKFAQGDFPFIIVSLPNYRARQEKPSESAWAEIREAQAQVAKNLPACGLAVTIDAGEAGNLHPSDKQPVGVRLALAARAVAYRQPVAWSGPWFRSMAVEGGRVRVSFDHVGAGLRAKDGAALAGFAVAGEDRNFVWADARIEGDAVVVSSERIPKPAAVRYGWADNPECNLTNDTGLPAVPFRTDDWPARNQPKPAPEAP